MRTRACEERRAQVRRLRTAKGWSLDQLAARSGVSKGMLVHLEQARTNPSLGTLCKVAETLGIPDGTARSRLHYATRALRTAFEASRALTALQEGRPA